MGDVTVSEVARRVEVSPGTLRRWVREGIVPLPAGSWTPAAIAHARMVARLRDRGHTLDEIRDASESGRLAYSYMEQLFPPEAGTRPREEEAVGLVERFVEDVADTLPTDARVIKTIGDEVMVVGTDAAALVDWAVEFQATHHERPLPRIGMHRGAALYRDGDYYGRAVNL